MLTLQLKTTRIILINNLNNLIQQLARQSKTPQKAGFFGDPALPAALKEYHVSVTKYINPQIYSEAFFMFCVKSLTNW